MLFSSVPPIHPSRISTVHAEPRQLQYAFDEDWYHPDLRLACAWSTLRTTTESEWVMPGKRVLAAAMCLLCSGAGGLDTERSPGVPRFPLESAGFGRVDPPGRGWVSQMRVAALQPSATRRAHSRPGPGRSDFFT